MPDPLKYALMAFALIAVLGAVAWMNYQFMDSGSGLSRLRRSARKIVRRNQKALARSLKAKARAARVHTDG